MNEKRCEFCAFRNDLLSHGDMTYCDLWGCMFVNCDKCSSFAREDKENGDK